MTVSEGGDGFVGGLLYAILRGWEPEKWPQFAWATGALVVTVAEDYGQPLDEAQVWSIYEGNARVKGEFQGNFRQDQSRTVFPASTLHGSPSTLIHTSCAEGLCTVFLSTLNFRLFIALT